MSEHIIIGLIPERVRRLGYQQYCLCYRDLSIRPECREYIPAFNELWFILDDPSGLVVESYYGIYDTTGAYIYDNVHQHRGEIIIDNPGTTVRRIKFIQVLLIS